MANANRTGFWPIKTQGQFCVTQRRKQQGATGGLAIFLGDCVTMVATGG